MKRKVRTDAIIRYNNKFYEVPMGYIGDTVTLVIDHLESSRAWITTDEDEKLLSISILD